MKKIHITLVGGQTMPVILGIIESKADKVLLIHSSGSRKELERVKQYLLERNLYSGDNLISEEIDAVDFYLVDAAAKAIFERYCDYEIEINISSGTKPWSIVFDRISKEYPNANTIYLDQNSNIYSLANYSKIPIQSKFSTSEILEINNKRTDNFLELTSFTEEDLKTMQMVKEIRNLNHEDFNFLTILNKDTKRIFYSNNEGEIFSSFSQSSISWNKNDNTVIITIQKNEKIKIYKLSSPNVMSLVFNAGWFEYEIAVLLSKWKYAKDVWLNVSFPSKTGVDKNEVDIIVNIGTKLLFVECKTQISQITDIDKFRTVVKNYGGMGCKSLFITDAKMTQAAKEKCDESDILTFSLSDSNLYLSSEQALFMMLESAIFNINKK